jgi:hypothetical protein
MADYEGISDTLAPGLCVHAGAVARGMSAPNDAVFVQWQATKASEFASEQQGLVEATLSFAFRVQRDGNDQVGALERLALLRREHQMDQTSSDVRLALQLDNGSP